MGRGGRIRGDWNGGLSGWLRYRWELWLEET